jgi:hypothetical protein
MSDAIVTKRLAEPARTTEQFSGGPTANRPASPARWLHYFDTDLGHDVVWSGTQWLLGPVGPIGTVGLVGHLASPDITGNGIGIGLFGTYYNNITLSNPVAATQYGAVDLAWPDGGPNPVPGVNPYSCSARWTGVVQIPVTGPITFSTLSDDGVRLYLNGILVINNWTAHGTTQDIAPPFNFTQGQLVPLVVEWYQGPGGPATIVLQWSYPGQPTQTVPLAVLGVS